MLDINTTEAVALSTLDTQWVQLNSTNPFDPEERNLPQVSVLADQTGFVVQGGQKYFENQTYGNPINGTIFFNITTQIWETWLDWDPRYQDIFYATAVDYQTESGEVIGYFGGKTYCSNGCSLRFTEITTFNTQTGEWSNVNCGGSDVPFRMGGISSYSLVMDDTIYVLNLNSYNWTRIMISLTDDFYRYDHSAVLVDTTLFLLFGSNRNKSHCNGMAALNVSDLSIIRQIDSYPYVIPTTTDDNNTTAGINPFTENQLNSGAKAGIAVGSILGAAAIGAILAYIRFLQKRQPIKEKSLVEEEIFVDWDKIESQYREINTRFIPSMLESKESILDATPDSQKHDISRYGHTSASPDV
ncbi:hypothetical protein G6F56_003414 [Rhizopus delemar]|uniref:Uncharacterized protein n=1 Tax=Rhizopus stolonifer TaxID=4846 RepID=A0A367J9R4_RHIST|nr:hypothetical protein G6F56_003414 [Rhizopus delemar]RCH86635.1 hypothetical protein CU098_007781 [Rhizopus stolonifer]